jgi:hypothetical protein
MSHFQHFTQQNTGGIKRLGSVWFPEVIKVRLASGGARNSESFKRQTSLIYICAAGIFMLGMSYAGVPLYRMFCQVIMITTTIIIISIFQRLTFE